MTQLRAKDLADATPAEVRALYESDEYRGSSWNLAPGYAQMALAAVPEEFALDFFTFCQRNSAACPVLEVVEPGERIRRLGSADPARTLGMYRVFQDGHCVDEPNNVDGYWRDDLFTFVIGCTGSFEYHFMLNGIGLDYLARGLGTPVFLTNRDANPSRRFKARLVVSMRPVKNELVPRAVQLSSRYPAFHGAPVQVGNPEYLGIDLNEPLAGSRLDIRADETPIFWACSVTPQIAAIDSKIPFMITNKPGYMFMSDLRTEAMAVFA
jgi:uncharacterized protein YcsI (UPF0317 family)